MGNTTVIELNHDLTREIEDNPDLFVQQILNQLRAGYYDDKNILGGTVICCFNRNGYFPDNEWEEFKTKIRKSREKTDHFWQEIQEG